MKINPTPLTKEQEYDPYKEIELVIKGWCRELDLEKTWVDNLHPADILEKHIFPQLRDIKAQAILQERNRIVEIVEKLKFSPKGCDENYWYTRGDRVIKSQIYWEAMKDLLKALENNER